MAAPPPQSRDRSTVTSAGEADAGALRRGSLARRGGYLWGLVAVATCLALCAVASPYLQLSELVMIALLGVVAVSTRFGIGPSLFTAAVTSVGFDFFFIPPQFAFAPSDMKAAITLGTMCVVAAIISGLGERSRREQEAVRARDLEIETERLRSSLLSAISHDVRTPLAAIFGAGSELLRDGSTLDEASRQSLVRTVVEESERLDLLVTNLLDLARLEAGSMTPRTRPEAVDEVFEAALDRLRGRLGGREVTAHVPESVPLVPMDGMLVQQVLVNLLENALRYTPEGSPLELEASLAGLDVSIELRDRGPGIPASERERVFDRFHRGEESRARDGGVGLGLTICRAIVEAHGGTIGIGPREGGGAVVRFTLPLRAPGSGGEA